MNHILAGCADNGHIMSLSSALAVCRDDSILDYRGGTLVTGRGRCRHR